MLGVEKRWLYQAVWASEPLGIDEDFEIRKREVEAQFDGELYALRDALLNEADGLDMFPTRHSRTSTDTSPAK